MTMNLATVLARTSQRSRTLCLAEKAGSVSNPPAFFSLFFPSHLSNAPVSVKGEVRRVQEKKGSVLLKRVIYLKAVSVLFLISPA